MVRAISGLSTGTVVLLFCLCTIQISNFFFNNFFPISSSWFSSACFGGAAPEMNCRAIGTVIYHTSFTTKHFLPTPFFPGTYFNSKIDGEINRQINQPARNISLLPDALRYAGFLLTSKFSFDCGAVQIIFNLHASFRLSVYKTSMKTATCWLWGTIVLLERAFWVSGVFTTTF